MRERAGGTKRAKLSALFLEQCARTEQDGEQTQRSHGGFNAASAVRVVSKTD